jgi:hypothetical protein
MDVLANGIVGGNHRRDIGFAKSSRINPTERQEDHGRDGRLIQPSYPWTPMVALWYTTIRIAEVLSGAHSN